MPRTTRTRTRSASRPDVPASRRDDDRDRTPDRDGRTSAPSERPARDTSDGPTFADLGVPQALVDKLASMDLHAPFAIQRDALPAALDGRDVAGSAPTGSGKTLAFALPLAVHVERAEPRKPRALVLTPTRELAGQVAETLGPLAEVRGRRTVTIYGGTNIKHDQAALRKGVDLVVATPGRLADLVQRGDCDLSQVDLVVLDEADRMADMGFLPEVRRLLDRTAKKRQTLLFSATLDGDVDVLVRDYQHNPLKVTVEADPDDGAEVRHLFWATEREDRRTLTTRALKGAGPAIVFTRTKRGADRLAKQLSKDGVTTAAIHGNRNQNQRERALGQFADGRVQALVATDVAARGIHVDDVALVLHYDLPGSDKDYVHRSGRTGRAGADGTVVSLVLPDQHDDLTAMQRALDMPTGTHPVDVDLVSSGAVPATSAPRRSSGGSSKSSGDGGQRGGGSGGQRTSNSSGQRSGGGRSRSGGGGKGGGGNSRSQPKGGARSPARRQKRR